MSISQWLFSCLYIDCVSVDLPASPRRHTLPFTQYGYGWCRYTKYQVSIMLGCMPAVERTAPHLNILGI